MKITRTEKISFLSRYGQINNLIDSKINELARWRAMATRITPAYSDSPHSPNTNSRKVENAIIKIMQIEADIDNEIDHLICVKEDIAQKINRIDDYQIRDVLTKRYLLCMNFAAIALELSYDSRQIYRLHRLGLSLIS